ncbi:hypothetical protein A3H12_01345 [Candidatus Uhrbacteria bacterium RIFCSPLOWO2_12_FULL_47_9]|nr:MAG: hypothetical protein A3H12_01345 [Candidatus Uhrbacteria bacterium RIFCSPLOWO2_12_FULL_47_9]
MSEFLGADVRGAQSREIKTIDTSKEQDQKLVAETEALVPVVNERAKTLIRSEYWAVDAVQRFVEENGFTPDVEMWSDEERKIYFSMLGKFFAAAQHLKWQFSVKQMREMVFELRVDEKHLSEHAQEAAKKLVELFAMSVAQEMDSNGSGRANTTWPTILERKLEDLSKEGREIEREALLNPYAIKSGMKFWLYDWNTQTVSERVIDHVELGTKDGLVVMGDEIVELNRLNGDFANGLAVFSSGENARFKLVQQKQKYARIRPGNEVVVITKDPFRVAEPTKTPIKIVKTSLQEGEEKYGAAFWHFPTQLKEASSAWLVDVQTHDGNAHKVDVRELELEPEPLSQ